MKYKKQFLYLFIAIICCTLAYMPINNKVLSLQDVDNIFDKKNIEVLKSSEEEITSFVEQSEETKVLELLEEETTSSIEQSEKMSDMNNSCEETGPKSNNTLFSEENSIKDNVEDDKPQDKNPTSSAEKKEEQKPETSQAPVIAAPVRKSVPSQTEDTSTASQSILNSVRDKVKGFIAGRCGAGYSNNCENIAILRANGSSQNAGALFTSYGNNVSWYELNGYDYTLGFNDNQLTEAVNKICSNFSSSFTGYSEYGCGVNIVKEDEYYKIKIVVVFCE